MVKLRLLWVILPALLAGCAPKAPITQAPVQMSFVDKTRSASVIGIDAIEVRTRLNQNDETVELAGVPCRLSGPGYSASFVTPAAVELPIFRQNAPQLSLSCRYEDETRTQALRARNITEEQRREARRRALDDLDDDDGGFRVLLSLDLSRSRRGFDQFRYSDTTFTFRR